MLDKDFVTQLSENPPSDDNELKYDGKDKLADAQLQHIVKRVVAVSSPKGPRSTAASKAESRGKPTAPT